MRSGLCVLRILLGIVPDAYRRSRPCLGTGRDNSPEHIYNGDEKGTRGAYEPDQELPLGLWPAPPL